MKELTTFKEAKLAYEAAQANLVKISAKLAIVDEQETELLNDLDRVQNEHDLAMDEAASKGDMDLLGKATDSLNRVKELVKAKENERDVTEKVLVKSEELLKLKRDEFRDCEKYLLLARAEQLESEAMEAIGDKLWFAWMARSKATGQYSPYNRDNWFKKMFPWPQDEDYVELSKLLE